VSRRRRRRRRARASAIGFSSFSARLVFFFLSFRSAASRKYVGFGSPFGGRSAVLLTSKLAIVFRRRERERGSVTQKFGTIAVRETPMKIARPIDLLFFLRGLTIQRLFETPV